MANYRAVANGNWSDPTIWGGGAVPPNGAGHNIYSNAFTVTIDQNVDVALITNAGITASFVGGGTSAAVGGGFTVSSGGFTVASATLTGPGSGSANLLTFSAASGTLTVNGNVSPGSANTTANSVIVVTSGGALVINGNVLGGSGYAQSAVNASSTAQVTVNGNITGSPFTINNNAAIPYGVVLSGQASLTVNNGTITGSNGNANNAAVINGGTGAMTFNNCIINAGTAVPAITNSNASATLTTVNCIHNASSSFACLSSSATLNRLSGTFVFGANGQIPVSATRYFLNSSPTNSYIQMALDGINSNSFVRFFTADNSLGQANPTDVRSGVTYASGNLTGRLTVPARGSVALSVNYGPSMPFTATRSGTTATATLAYTYPLVVGDQITVTGASNTEWNGNYTIASVVSGTSVTFTVPNTHSATAGTGATMQTTGTAVLDFASVASAVWGAATRTLTADIGPTAAQIRQELDANSTKLANLDTTVSSRLAPSGTLARVTLTDTATTLTNAPTVPTAAEIAAAVEGSLLNEADGQAVLNAIVGAIGNQNIDQVALVAAIRADIERTGGKLDSIPTTAAPTAAQNATAIWSAATRSVTGGTVDNLTNAPASVTPSDIWSHATRTLTSASGPTAAQIRQEIDANSTKLDAAISSRMAASEATKLDAVKAKTDALNIERLSNVATTSIVGTLLAQANS